MLFRHRLAYHSTSLLFVLTLVPHNDCSPPCQTYGCTKSLFLPAPPGHAPSCAKHGETFCEQIEHYPTHVIEYLVERWQFDYNSIFLSERKETKPRPMYGPPSHTYPYPPKTRIPTHYGRPLDQLLPPPSQHYNTFFPPQFNQSDIGYPDRRFPLSPAALQLVSDDPGFIYSAIIHPELAAPSVTPYDTNKWWKRYTRLARKKRAAIETEKHVNGTRVKRQVSDGRTTTLCPTTPRFIMPRAALNSKGNWMYVVNLDTDQRYTQLVRSETCISSQCNGICSLPNGYTSRCEQQFVQKRLVALDGSGDNLYTDIFWLPHCCICQITQVNL